MEVILFDLDGVILKEPSLREATGKEVAAMATEKALKEIGIIDVPEKFLEATRWGSYEKLVEAVETFDIDADPEKIWPMRERHLSKMEQNYIRSGKREPYEDIEVIDRLIEESIPLGIVSNARHSTVNCAVEYLRFDTANTAVRGQYTDPEDWYKQKPRPDYIYEVLENLNADTGIYVGDNESDIIAADQTGIDSAFIRRQHNRQVKLDHGPMFEFDTLYDLLEIL